ncbi:MAG: hypothetical protein ACFFAU_15580 [Candidatus Hodarchaeota archaeon]
MYRLQIYSVKRKINENMERKRWLRLSFLAIIKEFRYAKSIIIITLTVVAVIPFNFVVATTTDVEDTKTITSYEIEWSQSYGDTGSDLAGSVIQTIDSGYAFAGVYGLPEEQEQLSAILWLMKTNSSGYHVWNETFWCRYGWGIQGLIQTTDGGFAIAGFAIEGGDVILVKTDVNGNHEWNRTIGGNKTAEQALSIIQTVDEGYVLSGYSFSYGTGSQDFWLVKVNSTGYHEWNRTFGGNGDEVAWSIVHTTDGGFVLTGGTQSYGAGESDIWLLKVNSSGHHEWNHTFGGIRDDNSYSLVQTADGGFAIAGTTTTLEYLTENTFKVVGMDFWLVKTDKNGIQEWNRSFHHSGDESCFVMIQTSDHGFALAGDIRDSDTWFVKTNSTGHQVWSHIFPETGIRSMIQTSDGGIVLGGSTFSSAGDGDALLLKLGKSTKTTTTASSFMLELLFLSLLVLVVFSRKRRP